MNPVGPFMREFAFAVADRYGFRRKGQSYVKENDHGDRVVLSFAKRPFGEASVEMEVAAEVFLPAVAEFRRHLFDRPQVSFESAGSLWVLGVRPPRGLGKGYERGQWSYDTEAERAELGAALTRVLADEVVPLLDRLLDRDELRDFLREDDMRPKVGVTRMKVLTRIDLPGQPGLEQALELARLRDDQPLLEWVAQYSGTS